MEQNLFSLVLGTSHHLSFLKKEVETRRGKESLLKPFSYEATTFGPEPPWVSTNISKGVPWAVHCEFGGLEGLWPMLSIFILHIDYLLVRGPTHTTVHIWRSETTCLGRFSLTVMWLLGTELRWSGLVTANHWVISPVRKSGFYLGSYVHWCKNAPRVDGTLFWAECIRTGVQAPQ